MPMSMTQEEANKLLLEAATAGKNKKVQAALDAGAAIDAVDSAGITALMWAAYGNHSETCQLLLEKDADVNVANNNGNTALLAAAAKGYVKTCRLLLEKRADINVVSKVGITPLIRAAINGHIETCLLLLENGAHINAVDKDGNTPLILTAWNDHIKTCSLLLRQGAGIPAACLKGEGKVAKLISGCLAEMKASAQAAFPTGQKPARKTCLTPEGKPTDAVLDACATDQFAALIAAPLLHTKHPDDRKLFLDIYKALPKHWQNEEAALYLQVRRDMQPARTPPATGKGRG
jgi:26S proteasome non-ATPase regulatory subunit 10